MNARICCTLALPLTAGCAHIDVQSTSQCDGAHLPASQSAQALQTGNANAPIGFSFATRFAAKQLPAPGSLQVEISPLMLTVHGGTWSFAKSIAVTITGADPTTEPDIQAADYPLTASDAASSSLSIPLNVSSATLLSYLRAGPITLNLAVTGSGAPPGDIDLSVCHSASGTWDWNIASGTH
jgi:hypothetical protein